MNATPRSLKQYRAAVSQYLAQLSARERRLATVGGVAALALLILAILLPLQQHVGAGQERLARKRDDLLWLRSMAPQLAGLRTSVPSLHESLVVVVDRTARQAGLDKALVGSQPSGDGGLNVRLEQTSFDGLITWLSQLRESYGVKVDSAVVDAGNSPGTVNASLVLRAR
jgi:general secretion pathway protein M